MLLFGRLGFEGLLIFGALGSMIITVIIERFGFECVCCLVFVVLRFAGAWVSRVLLLGRLGFESCCCLALCCAFCVAGALGFTFVCFLVVCFECLCCLRAGALKIYVFGTFVVVFALLGLWVSRAFVVWVLVF